MSNKPFAIQDGIKFSDGTVQTTAYTGQTSGGNTSGVFLLDDNGSIDTITTPTTVVIDGMLYGGGEVVQDSAFGPGSSRVTLYADSMFAMVAVNADIETVYYNGETGADGGGTKTVSASVQNYRGFYARRNLIKGDDPAISQIVISKSSTMTATHRSADTNNDDFTVTGLSGSDVVIVLNIYWDEVSGPSYTSSITTGVEKFIDLVMFDETTERTSASAIRTAFYANSDTIKNAIENEDGDYLTGENSNLFEFYEGYQAVTPTNIAGSGSGAVLSVRINDSATYNTDDILVPGTGYQVADELLVLGTVFGGTTPANDMTIIVTAIDAFGGIDGWSETGTAPTDYWPLSYIIDGDEDQYDTGNFIGTNRTRVTAVVTVDDTTSPDQLTIISTDKALINNGVGQWIWVEDQDEGALITWPLEINFGDNIGDIVVEVDSEYTKLTLANKDFTLETTRTGTQDADINLFAADDIFIEARGDDIALSAKDQVRINTNSSFDGPGDDRTWTFDREGRIRFPDDTFQTTAYPGDNDVWVQTFETATGAPADVPVITTSVEYLGDGDIVALIGHSNNIDNGSYSGVARFTSAGELVWSMSFDGALYTTGWGLAVDNANGYIYVAGYANGDQPLGAAYDVATLTKLAQADGAVVWSKTYDVGVDNVNTVVDVASDGSPVVVGFVESEEDDQIVTSKINATDGSVTWSRAIDGQGDENAYGMAVGPTGEIVTVGYMDQFGVTDGAATLYTVPASNPNWTSPLNASVGGVNLTVTFTGGVPTFTNVSDTLGNRTVDDELGGISGGILGGVTGVDDMTIKVATVAANDTDNRMVVAKYNSAGSIQWQKAVQVVVGYDCSGADADIDSEGNIYVCGNFEYNDGGLRQSVIIIKFNSLGVKQWTRKITGDCGDFATSIVVGPDNFLYLSAVTVNVTNTNVNMVIAKYDRDGDVEWQRLLSNTTDAVFAGEFFITQGGGSNLAVKEGYVAVGGGFGDIDNFPFSVPNAIVAQVGSHGAEFLAGNFEFEVAGFSGNLDSDASNITVVDAGKTDSNYAGEFTVSDFDPAVDLISDLIGTLYHGGGGENRLFNSGQSLILETTGAVTLPKGGSITEGVVTSNPTIQLTPARPDVASQKLVIKGGAGPLLTTVANNNIELEWSDTTAIVGDTVTFTIVDSTTYANQTLYWWIHPENAGIGDSNSGTVAIDANGDGTFSIEIDRDDYEFTVRVSPENNNYDPDNLGVESYPINASAPTYPDYHLHLTTGDLTETSIFLGTDDHNVRTTTAGNIEINTPGIVTVDGIVLQGTGYTDGSYTAQATTGGSGTGLTVDYLVNTNQVVTVTINQQGVGYNNGDVITIPGGSSSATVLLEVTANNVWEFGTDGTITFPDATVQTTASIQGEHVFTLNTGAITYAPTAVDFNLLFVTAAAGYSATNPTSVTLPNGVPGQRLVIFNGYNLATLTVNPGVFGRDISSGVAAEFIYSGFDGLWMPLYGTNSLT